MTSKMKELIASLDVALANVHQAKMLLQQTTLQDEAKVEVNELVLDISNTVKWLEGEVK